MRVTNFIAPLLALLMTTAGLAGCIQKEDLLIDDVIGPDIRVLRIAYMTQDDYENPNEDPQSLATYLGDILGMEVELYQVTSDGMAIEALRFGHADIAFMDGASGWVGWQKYDLDVLAADQKSDGRTYYNAHAWVLNGSDIANAYLDDDDSTDPFALMEGKTSCHTGWLKSAGMLMPMGYLIGNEYASIVGDSTDISSLRTTIESYFSENALIPDKGTPYYGYGGAVKCLSDGTGDVAFAKDSTVDSYCANDDSTDNEDWCLAIDEYIKLPTFGKSPSHPVMYNPATISIDASTLQIALVAMNQVETGRSVLSNLLSTDGFSAIDAETHLGSYGGLISEIPGIDAYYNDKYEISQE
jgi:ABC-type phosphate/phosphonate transport system substrate-binding protein